jgi:hypothetical protein
MIVQFGSNPMEVNIEGTQNLLNLISMLEEKTGVPRAHMKLISHGKMLFPRQRDGRPLHEVMISDLPLGTKSKILMVGNATYEETPKELPRIKGDMTEEGRQRCGKYVIDANDLNIRTQQFFTYYRFHTIQTLPNLPDEHKAREILSKLASDPGILSVMAKHKWSVGALCELYPEGLVGVRDVCVLGLNENRGQRIFLRLRTDDLKGFRKILSIRKVLYHELAHNVHSDHGDNFFMLMRQIEREAKELDWSSNRGSTEGATRHQHYDSSASSTHQQAHTLGNASLGATGNATPSLPPPGVVDRSRFTAITPPAPSADQHDEKEGDSSSHTISVIDAEPEETKIDWSRIVMEAVDAKVADAYVYLLDIVDEGRGAAVNAELEEKLPALREAVHDLCAANSDSVAVLSDAMTLLKNIINRAMMVCT